MSTGNQIHFWIFPKSTVININSLHFGKKWLGNEKNINAPSMLSNTDTQALNKLLHSGDYMTNSVLILLAGHQKRRSVFKNLTQASSKGFL